MKTVLTVALLLCFISLAKAQTTVQVPYNGTATATIALSTGTETITIPYSGSVPEVIPAGCTLSTALVVTCPTTPVTPPPVTPPTPPPVTGRTKIVPSGSDDGPAILAAAGKGPMELGCTTYPCSFKQTPITFPANTDLLCDDGVTVNDMPGYSSYAVLWQATATGKFAGASADARADSNACKLSMPNSFKTNSTNTNQSTNQYNHCFQSYMATNVSVTGLAFANCGGDSIYIQFTSGITVNGVASTSPTRNGLSATDQNTNVLIEHSSFNNAQNFKVAGIADGVDIEPNGTAQGVPLAGDFVKGVTLLDVQTNNNARTGVCMCLWFMSSSTSITVTLTSVQASGNSLFQFEQNGPAFAGITGSGNTPAFPTVALRKSTKQPTSIHKLN
jgi:hypothetical protein